MLSSYPIHFLPNLFAVDIGSRFSIGANKYKIHIVEDACMGIGAKVDGKKPGNFGIVNAFSMHPLKPLNVMGDGGMVLTNNDQIAMWCKRYRNHGMIDRDHISSWGVNMRLQPLQAIVANIELKKVRKVINIRNRNARLLDKHLSNIDGVSIPERKKNHTETFALYMARFRKRDKLKSYLIKNKIEQSRKSNAKFVSPTQIA